MSPKKGAWGVYVYGLWGGGGSKSQKPKAAEAKAKLPRHLFIIYLQKALKKVFELCF
jgi:hypothetical protein